ncbi:uncharacterized protein [Rutidosis leptorrhynchoides]|uniref:uncharacterized protein n=1 Tax=Rutidosis leptorrhynchoides TaxID=125765 RepID=UPI003A99687E
MAVSNRVNSAVAKRLWNVLRVTLLMIRKGLISKRKLIMDMNLMMKRGKLLRKSFSNLIHIHHHHNSKHMTSSSRGRRSGIQDYEFSCSNSPNPVFFHVSSSFSKRKLHFPCINPPQVIEDDDDVEIEYNKTVALLPKTPEYAFNVESEFASGEKLSPFHVRVSNYSSEDENEVCGIEIDHRVDDDAEEFIKRFYEQLKVQSRMQLLQYQEMEYKQMLARGTQ